MLSGFALARASAGLADGTIRGDVGHLERIRSWFGRPLWGREPADADVYFGKVLRNSPSGTRPTRSQGDRALTASEVERVSSAGALPQILQRRPGDCPRTG